MTRLHAFAPSPLWYGDEPDHRTDKEKLDEAIERHLANAALLKALQAAGGELDEQAYGAADKAWQDSQAQLFRLVEDVTLVSVDKLIKALMS